MPRRLIAILGAAGSVALMAYAGRHNPSGPLVLAFAIWVASPFVAAAWAKSVPMWATVVLAVASLAIYAAEAFEQIHVKLGFLFLVMPLVSWVWVGVAAAIGRAREVRGSS